MKIKLNEKTFKLTFSNEPDAHRFTLSNGNVSYTAKIRNITKVGISKHIIKAFDLSLREYEGVPNGLLWKIANAYTEWYNSKRFNQ